MKRWALAVLVGMAGVWAAEPPATSPPADVLPLTANDVGAHLGKTVDWYHRLATVEQSQLAADDTATRDKLHQQAVTAVKLALEFGKACAAILDAQSRLASKARESKAATAGATPAPPAGTPSTQAPPPPAPDSKGFAGRLDQAAEDMAERVATLQSQLESLKEQIASARGKQRETLVAQQGQATAALQLAKQVQASVQSMEDFEARSIAGDNGNLSPLEGQIADVERSVPEAKPSPRGSAATNTEPNSPATGAPGGSTAGAGGTATNSGGGGTAGGSAAASQKSANPFRPESAGVVALATQWYSLRQMGGQLGDALKETKALEDVIGKNRATLTDEVRKLIGNGLAISTTTDPAQLLAQRDALEAGTTRFRQLSTVLVPLGEQALTVDSAAGTLADWSAELDSQMDTIARYIATRIGILLGWIAVVLVISEIWKRATFRYLQDLRRRRQFMVLRRVAVGIALTVVIMLGMVSEIGSIATYAGFVTAGVAVALQNVILAVVAYFFLIGRYGVRVGDRITLAGVTGRVVDIGLVRIYLMELSGPDLHSTGRMVVLSNAVLFQPTALFKQIPGADYVWHTVTLTLDATADVVEAHKRLKAAAEAIYDKYRAAIERQHAVVQRFIDFDASSPQPELRLRLTENGLECAVRYPVELDNAAVIDQQMLKALRDALEQDSRFKLVATGAVVLKSSE